MNYEDDEDDEDDEIMELWNDELWRWIMKWWWNEIELYEMKHWILIVYDKNDIFIQNYKWQI